MRVILHMVQIMSLVLYYLRDNMVTDVVQMVQRPLNYAIVDEVDSILIDEARTPLIISGPGQRSTDNYYKLAKIVPHLIKDEDYVIDENKKLLPLQILASQRLKKCLVLKTYMMQKISS